MSNSAGSPTGYGFDVAVPVADHDTVTLSTGTSFLIATTDGSIRPGGVQGYYVADTRLLNMLRLSIDGEMPRVLSTHQGGTALRVTGAIGDPVAPHLLVVQEIQLSDELMLTLDIENLTSDDRDVSVELAVNADFADLFDVKRGVPPRGGLVTYGALDDDLIFRYQNEGFRRGIRIHIDEPDVVLRDGIGITQRIAGHERITVHATATPVLTQRERPVGSARLHQQWLAGEPASAPESVPERIWHRSWDDLGTLMMVDPIDTDRTIVAAGSPWFMALFGRDSLITSWGTLPYRTDLALGVLDALAARQGAHDDDTTLEQPGRIPHEARRGEAVQRAGGWGSTFYGTVDATPLFVMTLARAWRFGAPTERIEALIPAARAAVDWIVGAGDLDGDGFVEYPGVVTGASGLANQGWKDSFDAIRHADGSLAAGPIALVEVQGYCHAAFLALADLYEKFGGDDPAPWRERASTLRDAIEAQFWVEDIDCYALALDGDKRPVATVTTNAGHLLFTGTTDGDRAARVVRRLMAADMFTGFGLRTLSADNPAYNPLSYHCGSVWPHDTALVAAGMLRFDREAGRRLALALLDAAEPSGRLPELFGGFSRDDHSRPVPYPTSCSPQAWAAAAPLLLASELD